MLDYILKKLITKPEEKKKSIIIFVIQAVVLTLIVLGLFWYVNAT